MPHDISLLQGLLAQQVGMLAKIQSAFRHFIGPSMPRLKARSSARVWPAKCPYSPECVEGEFSEVHPQTMPIGRSTVPAVAPRIMDPS
jgi:hypothetical protein